MVQVSRSPTSTDGSTVALKAFPPTIWWTWAEGALPGSTTGSRRWTVSVLQSKRRAAWESWSPVDKARRVSGFLLEG